MTQPIKAPLTIDYFVGMDPAGPFYEGGDKRVRLNPTNAKFVDITHSNAKPLTSGGAGMFAASGHVDFYPNGGKTQPGCPDLFSGLLGDIFGLNWKGKHFISIMNASAMLLQQLCPA